MAETLIPYTKFDSASELALQLQFAVKASQNHLEARNILGPNIRYGGDLDTALENVEKGQAEHDDGKLGHFAVISEMGDVVGAASIYPELKLRKLRMPIPPRAAIGPLAVDFSYASPNIHAWATDEDVLSAAYQGLVAIVRSGAFKSRVIGSGQEKEWSRGQSNVWTLEPTRSPGSIHEAITAGTGLVKVATRRFDDEETAGLHIPPRATLYAELNGSWSMALGRQKELRTGLRGMLQEFGNGIGATPDFDPGGAISRDSRRYS